MIGWFKRKLAEREAALVEKDAQVRAHWSEAKQFMAEREQMHLDRKKNLDERMQILASKTNDLLEYKNHLETRASFLDRMQRDIDHEKESMLGKDNLEIKKNILLPVMKQKWEAEAKLLDSQRSEILLRVPQIYVSIQSRLMEYSNHVALIKGKPASMGNQNLLIEYQSRLKEVTELIEIIDKERAKNAEPAVIPFPNPAA